MINEEIEELYREDIRDKKRTGSGVFHKGNRSKNNFKNSLNTPYNFMSSKEKKLLNGEVTVTNIYDMVLPRKEFDALDYPTQKKLFTRWREIYSNKEIIEGMGITSNATFWAYLNKLEIPRQGKGYNKRTKENVAAKENVADNTPTVLEPKSQLITRGLHLEYHGEYDHEALNRIFTKLQLLTDGEPNKYVIAFSISERVS